MRACDCGRVTNVIIVCVDCAIKQLPNEKDPIARLSDAELWLNDGLLLAGRMHVRNEMSEVKINYEVANNLNSPSRQLFTIIIICMYGMLKGAPTHKLTAISKTHNLLLRVANWHECIY